MTLTKHATSITDEKDLTQNIILKNLPLIWSRVSEEIIESAASKRREMVPVIFHFLTILFSTFHVHRHFPMEKSGKKKMQRSFFLPSLRDYRLFVCSLCWILTVKAIENHL